MPVVPRARSGVTRGWIAVFAAAAGALLGGCGGGSAAVSAAAPSASAQLVVVLPGEDALAFVNPDRGEVARVAVGASPWGVAVSGGRAYVSTARHVAVVDTTRRRLITRVPYRTRVSRIERGEYRGGGMGVAASANGGRVYVGLNAEDGGRGTLEVLDTRRLSIVDTAPIGVRPFDVLVSRDGDSVYTVDHDSYGVTALDARTLRGRFFPVAPLGRGAFEKLNYGAVDARGRVLLPVNGEVLAILDPRTGSVARRPLRARVHQAGVAISRGRLLTVGAEALDGDRGPNLSIYDLASRRERVLPLRRPHEDLAVSADGRAAYLTGGYTRGGWNGITIVTLASGRTRELPLPGMPLGIAVLPGRAATR